MRRLRVTLAVAAIALAVPAAAGADEQSIYSRVLQSYQANGQIPPCQFTSGQLSAALKGVDTYGQQYFADFTDAIDNALAARASGACLSGSGLAHAASNRSAGGAPFVAPSITGGSGARLPAAILVLAALTMVLGLGFGLGVLAIRRGWTLGELAAARHGAGETSYRLAERWDELAGRLRSGGTSRGRAGMNGGRRSRRFSGGS